MSLRALFDVPAPAKLNLFLHVVGRRADGYHLLQSVFVLIDWFDRLHFERRSDGRLSRIDLGSALPADDLCLRAARALQSASGTRLGAEIAIDKQVPAQAGLGGGSSDAASTLLALNRLWNLNWPRERLASLALGLGADVPFFIHGRNALVEGIGERIRELPLPPAWYAVVKPAAGVATAGIFAHPGLKRDTDPAIVEGYLARAGEGGILPGWLKSLVDLSGNDLQGPAEEHCPEVSRVASWLHLHFSNSRMTGSGSAVFAWAGEGVSPSAVWTESGLAPDWVGRMCHGLVEHPLVGWAR